MNRVRTSPVREREREKERKREREIKREGEREIERERGRDREFVFLFLKGVTGALAPFSFLVRHNKLECLTPYKLY